MKSVHLPHLFKGSTAIAAPPAAAIDTESIGASANGNSSYLSSSINIAIAAGDADSAGVLVG